MARSGRVQQSRRRGSSAGFAARLTALAVVAALVATLAPAVPRSAPAEADTSPFGVYRPITPKRLHDTNVAGWGTIDLKVTGGTSGVPEPSAGTKAVALEVTAFPVTTGYGLVYEQGTPRPATSSLNYIPGEYVTNLVTVKPSAGGNISYYSALSNARVVVDVIGYYEASGTGAGYAPVSPARIFDTRPNLVPANTVTNVKLRGLGGVPDDPRVVATTVMITVTGASADGFLTVYPPGTNPGTASMSFSAGKTQTSTVIAKLGPSGYASIYNMLSPVTLTIDVVGYEMDGSGARFRPSAGQRILDTRNGTGGHLGALGPCQQVDSAITGVGGVPSERVTAVAVNLTAVLPSSPGSVTAWSTGSPQPAVTSVSFTDTTNDVANLVFLQPGSANKASFATSCSASSTHVVADVVGYFLQGGDPFGSLDSATGHAGGVDVRGWATDADTADPIDVQVSVDGALAGTTRASEGRPDLTAAYPDYGAAHGFSFFAAAAAGTNHNVCATAVNVYSGANKALGCRGVDVTAADARAGDGLGERPSYAFEDFALTDRLQAKVNTSSGNLVLAATELTMAGTGIDLGLGHHYNSRSAQDNPAGVGWTLSTASGVFLEHRSSDGAKIFHAPGGAVIVFTPDGAGFRPPPDFDATLVVNGSGHRLTMMGDKSSWDFDGGGRAVAQRGPNDDLQLHRNTISFTYGAPGAQLSSVTDSRGRAVTFAYNGAGRLGSMTDVANGRVFTYGYDPAGRLLETIIGPPLVAGGPPLVTTFGYVGDNLSSVTDAQGHVTTIEYWPDDRVKFVKRDIPEPTGTNKPTTGFTYYPKGAQTCVNAGFGTANPCTRVADPRHSDTNSMLTTYKFDAQGNHRVEKVKDALGRERSTQYNSSGNVTNYADALGAVSTLDYDPTGHAVTASKLPTGASSTYNYGDTANNPRRPTGVTDAQNNTTGFVYDGAGNTKSVSANRESDPYYSFDYNTAEGTRKDGTVKWAKDPVEPGRPAVYTNFSYDDKGQRTGVDHPAPLGDETFTYDNASRVSSHTDGLGRLTSYEYDAYDRVTKTTYADAAVISYTYDAAGNRKMMVDQSGPSTYDYDKLNRLKTQTLPGLRTNSYDYDDSGNLAGYADAAGSVTYGHNTLNLVDRVTEPGGYATTISYDDANRRDKVSYPNGVVQDVDYDTSGRTRSVKATKGSATLTSFAYTYDKSGADSTLRQSMAENVPGVVNDKTTYAYDGLDRLDTASTTTQPSGPAVHSYDYDYDRRSNRTKATVDGGVIHYAYNDASELCWSGPAAGSCASPPAGSSAHGFDTVGNHKTSSAGLSLNYNAKNQTTSMTPPGGVASTHAYTGATQDNRIQAGSTNLTNSVLGVSYAYQGPLPLPISTTAWTRDDQGNLISQRSPDGPDANLEPDRHYYLTDGLGSVVAMTDEAGGVVNRYRYRPYGSPLGGAGTMDTVANPWRYAGGYRDADTGFTKFGARYYDPALGRWTQRDPSGQDANPYAYVGGDPVNLVDPSGLFSIKGVFDKLKCVAGEVNPLPIFASEGSLVPGGLAVAGGGTRAGLAAALPLEAGGTTFAGGATVAATALAAPIVAIGIAATAYGAYRVAKKCF